MATELKRTTGFGTTTSSTLELPMDSCSQSSTTELKQREPRVYRSKLFILAISFSGILILIMTAAFIVHYVREPSSVIDNGGKAEAMVKGLPQEQKIWLERGLIELQQALGRQDNKRRAKNVILFVGDGMGPNTVTAARIMAFKEEGLMSWEKFPDMGLLKVNID